MQHGFRDRRRELRMVCFVANFLVSNLFFFWWSAAMFNSSSPFRACSCVPETSSRTTPQPAAALKPLKLPLLGQKVLLEAWCFDSKLWLSVLQTRCTNPTNTTPLLIRILRPEQMRYLPRAEGGATDQRHGTKAKHTQKAR